MGLKQLALFGSSTRIWAELICYRDELLLRRERSAQKTLQKVLTDRFESFKFCNRILRNFVSFLALKCSLNELLDDEYQIFQVHAHLMILD